METEDRVKQVNYLRELAGYICFHVAVGGYTAEQLVEYALLQGEIDPPSWFDAHDQMVLTRFVAESLA